jgi:SAM-dependent methyltransferase
MTRLPQRRPVDIARCSVCGLTFVVEDYTDQELEKAYGAQDVAAYYAEISRATGEKATSSARDLKRLGVHSILDVGCGFGHMLEAARDVGIEAEGFEISGQCADRCSDLGFTVHVGELEKVERQYEAVTLLDVAEHVPNPLRTFRVCRELAQTIYIHTPRVSAWDHLFLALVRLAPTRSLAHRWLKSRLSVAHLQLWSDRSLRVALSRSGWRVIDQRAETELSWPVEKYVDTYGRFLPRRLALLIARAIRPTLKNKAVVVAVSLT